ncbi:uncharacterized protein LOC126549119 isoform X1 [Aphis gossypii]|uniref:uncharacterized protein LOC126549119 isoform X1 n=1 Tax=Aphis gossypii TaxID=80765 RepID=UPI002158FD4F|nr:uncharacterized protein LOC126549119 isoform X1 [Aphis gossypii]
MTEYDATENIRLRMHMTQEWMWSIRNVYSIICYRNSDEFLEFLSKSKDMVGIFIFVCSTVIRNRVFIHSGHTYIFKGKINSHIFFTSSLLAQRAGRREREPREVAVGATPRTIEARLDTLEEAIRKLSSQLAYFKQKQEPRNHTETVQSPQTPKINSSSSSWCYYHLRFGKEARKCGSNLCKFTPS